MISKEELDIMAKNAKKKLEGEADIQSDTTDIYAELREEVGEIESDNKEKPVENIVIKNQYEEGYIRGQSANISSFPDEEDLKSEHEILPYDEPLFVGGPTKTQLDSWKKQWQGYDVMLTEIQNQYFIFRTLNRFEYKQIVALPNIDALQREEIICETVTLFPQNYKWDLMAKDKAGIPSTFSQIIMEKSGFTNEYAIEVL